MFFKNYRCININIVFHLYTVFSILHMGAKQIFFSASPLVFRHKSLLVFIGALAQICRYCVLHIKLLHLKPDVTLHCSRGINPFLLADL